MKKIGYAEDIDDYEEQIDYLGGLLGILEDLELAYLDGNPKDDIFKDEKKQIHDQFLFVEELYENLKEEMEELLEEINKEDEEELRAMNAEFERSRL